jgi:hypothetical protein
MTALAAVAAWLQPILLVSLAFRVTAGEADAPWLALAALVAPLVALLAPARRPSAQPVIGAAAALAVTLLLAADFLVAADVATLLGVARWQGVALAALPTLVVAAWPAVRRAAPALVALALVALVLIPVALGLAGGAPPWAAWSRSGLRAALTFPPGSAWVVSGERFARDTTLRFEEGQRVTVLTAGRYRVVEHDAVAPTTREWRLAGGESLTLRPGDELSVDAGARLRFEAGRRVPGAPASGMAWADAPARGPRMLPLALGALVTLVGGALALVPPLARGRGAATGPLVALAATTAALAWGVYAAAASADLVLAGALPAPLLRLPALVLGTPAGTPLVALTLLALLALLTGAAGALRERLVAVASPAVELWVAIVVVATALAVWPFDAWRLFGLGLGLAAAAWAPARLAETGAGAVAGAIAGGVAFAALAVLPAVAPGAPPWLDALARYPALIALPLGWLVARALPSGEESGEPAASAPEA